MSTARKWKFKVNFDVIRELVMFFFCFVIQNKRKTLNKTHEKKTIELCTSNALLLKNTKYYRVDLKHVYRTVKSLKQSLIDHIKSCKIMCKRTGCYIHSYI